MRAGVFTGPDFMASFSLAVNGRKRPTNPFGPEGSQNCADIVCFGVAMVPSGIAIAAILSAASR